MLSPYADSLLGDASLAAVKLHKAAVIFILNIQISTMLSAFMWYQLLPLGGKAVTATTARQKIKTVLKFMVDEVVKIGLPDRNEAQCQF